MGWTDATTHIFVSAGSVAAFEDISYSESDVSVILLQHKVFLDSNDISMFYKVNIL